MTGWIPVVGQVIGGLTDAACGIADGNMYSQAGNEMGRNLQNCGEIGADMMEIDYHLSDSLSNINMS